MANPPPPYSDITGISRAVMKDNAQESLSNYNGNARPGELVVNLEVDPPALYIGNNAGQLTSISSGGGAAGLPLANGTSNFNIAAVNGNATVTVSGSNTWIFDVTGNLSVPRDINFDGGSITQVLNEDFYIRASDDEDEGWAIINAVDNGDPSTVYTQTRLTTDDFLIQTDIQGASYQWYFDSQGRLNLPNGGNIQGEYGGNSSFYAYDDGDSGSVELKTISYAGDTLGSNVRVTQSNATISTSNAAFTWTFDNTGKLTLPTIQTGDGTFENATIQGTRKVIGEAGNWSTYIDGHSTFGTEAWTASSSTVQSAKITFVVQTNGVAYNWEQFDVTVCRLDSANAYVSVSGRVRQNSVIDYTEVSGYISAGSLSVWLNPADGQTVAYVNYDAVEFNIMAD